MKKEEEKTQKRYIAEQAGMWKILGITILYNLIYLLLGLIIPLEEVERLFIGL